MIFITVLWCFGSRYKVSPTCDLYLGEVQGVKWYVCWEAEFTYKKQEKYEYDLSQSMSTGEVKSKHTLCI